MAEGESEKNDQKQEENSVSHDLVDELQEIENMVLNPNINVENLVEEASNGTVIYNIECTMKFFLVLKRGLSKSCPRVHDFLCTKPNLAKLLLKKAR
jgi:hypothetical protein